MSAMAHNHFYAVLHVFVTHLNERGEYSTDYDVKCVVLIEGTAVLLNEQLFFFCNTMWGADRGGTHTAVPTVLMCCLQGEESVHN